MTHHLSHTQLCHTPSFTHTTLSHTIFHIQLCHTPSFTCNFVTHHLSHTTLSHTIFHTQLCQPPSSHTIHTTLSHTIFHTHLCHTPSFTYNFVTPHLSHTTLSTTIFHTQLCQPPWQAWHHLTIVLRGRRATYGGALGSVLVAGDAVALCVAGVALGDIYLRLAWQAWHLVTSTFVLRDRCGTYGTGWRAWVGFSRR